MLEHRFFNKLLGEEQGWIDSSLRNWAKSTETHSTDQNHLCESRYNRHIFCSGKIPPAGETAAVWQMGIPRVPDVFPTPTLLELIKREKKLVREQRERRWLLSRIVSGYEADWCTQAERDDLLRATKKARRAPHGLSPRSIVKDIDGRVPLNVVPTLKTGNLPQPSDDSLHEWNKILLEHSKTEKTPLKEEIDSYASWFIETGREKSRDDKGVNGFEFDGINNDGMRETTLDGPNDVNRRSEYQKKYLQVIPYDTLRRGRTREAEQAVRNHRDFLVDAVRHHAQRRNTPIVEIAEQMGVSYDWLRQQFSRGNQTLDVYQTNPNVAAVRELIGNRKTPIPDGFNVAIRLNNTAEIKYLGALTDSPKQHLRALSRHQKLTIKDALKNVRRKARANGWKAELLKVESQATHTRIAQGYRLFFEMFQEENQEGEGNVVTVSS
jgi:hypothetical protein